MDSHEIECDWHSNKERKFYVDENFRVLPCCFYVMNDQEMLEFDPKFKKYTEENPDWNNLKYKTIDEIINSEIYQDHLWYPGWENNPSLRCLKTCGRKRITPKFVQRLFKTE